MAKEIPILFSTEMVSAILSGTKTMTRRIVKPRPDYNVTEIVEHSGWKGKTHAARVTIPGDPVRYEIIDAWKCRYGKPGDILWVREKWNMCPNDQLISDEPHMRRNDGIAEGGWWWIYAAGNKYTSHPDHKEWGKLKWKPSIHMPKDAARIWLEVINIRVERLQDITEEEAINEGIQKIESDVFKKLYRDYNPQTENGCCATAISSFQSLWGRLMGMKAGLQILGCGL